MTHPIERPEQKQLASSLFLHREGGAASSRAELEDAAVRGQQDSLVPAGDPAEQAQIRLLACHRYFYGFYKLQTLAWKDGQRPNLPPPRAPELQHFKPANTTGVSAPASFHFCLDAVARDSLSLAEEPHLETLWALAVPDILRCPPHVAFSDSAVGVVFQEIFARWVKAANEGQRANREALAATWLTKIAKNAQRPKSDKLFFALDNHTEILLRKPAATLRTNNPDICRERGTQTIDGLFSAQALRRNERRAMAPREETDRVYQAAHLLRLGDPTGLTPAHGLAVATARQCLGNELGPQNLPASRPL